MYIRLHTASAWQRVDLLLLGGGGWRELLQACKLGTLVLRTFKKRCLQSIYLVFFFFVLRQIGSFVRFEH